MDMSSMAAGCVFMKIAQVRDHDLALSDHDLIVVILTDHEVEIRIADKSLGVRGIDTTGHFQVTDTDQSLAMALTGVLVRILTMDGLEVHHIGLGQTVLMQDPSLIRAINALWTQVLALQAAMVEKIVSRKIWIGVLGHGL